MRLPDKFARTCRASLISDGKAACEGASLRANARRVVWRKIRPFFPARRSAILAPTSQTTPTDRTRPCRQSGRHLRYGDHLRALAQRVEVADTEVRIMGSKSELPRTLVAVSSGKPGVAGVHSSILKWRTGPGVNP